MTAIGGVGLSDHWAGQSCSRWVHRRPNVGSIPTPAASLRRNRRTNRLQRTPRLRLGSMAKVTGAGSLSRDISLHDHASCESRHHSKDTRTARRASFALHRSRSRPPLDSVREHARAARPHRRHSNCRRVDLPMRVGKDSIDRYKEIDLSKSFFQFI